MENAIRSKFNRVTVFDKIVLCNWCLGIVLIFCVITSSCKISSIVSFVTMIFFMLLLLIKNTIIFLKYLHFIFAAVAAIIGCAVIEFSNIFLPELSTQASFGGTLPMLVFSWWVFLVVIKHHDSWMVKRQEQRKYVEKNREIHIIDYFATKKYRNIVTLILACTGGILIIYSFFVVFKDPAFVLGLDRFQYSEEFEHGFVYNQATRLAGFLIIPVVVLALYKRSKICWGVICIYCLYAFWTGNKFGIFFSLLCTFSMLLSQKIDFTKERNEKTVIGILLVIVILIGVAVFGVSITNNNDSTDYLLQRTAQQGQLWWKTYNDSRSLHISEIGDEIETIATGEGEISENVGSQYGIYKIMYYVAPHTQIDNKLRSGSRYTETGFAAAYYYLGTIGCILFAVLGAVLTSFFVNSFLFHLRYNQWIRAFIHFRLYGFAQDMISMFIFFSFFGKVSVLCYIILFICKKKIFRIGKNQV